MIARCPKCGFKIELDDLSNSSGRQLNYKCPKCGAQMIADVPKYNQAPQRNMEQNRPQPQERFVFQGGAQPQQPAFVQPPQPPVPPTPPQQPVQNQPEPVDNNPIGEEKTGHKSKALPIILIAIGVMAIAAVGIFVFYLPYLKDKNAPRAYSIANATNLRSSRDAGGDYNKIRSLPYGSELKTYSADGEWTEVKDADGEKGFMSSEMLVNKSDFLLLNSIFGDQESRENIATIKCRKALLNYFKDHHFYGKLSQENLKIVNPQAVLNADNQWQVFCRAKGLKPNSVYFPRLTNANSKYTDFAVIIKNISTNARKLLLFNFEDNGTSHLVTEQDAPDTGYIIEIWEDMYSNVQVQYSE